VAFGRILLAWAVVGVWLALWAFGERRVRGAGGLPPKAELAPLAGEALLLALFAALWFGSLGSGAWWLVFLLLGGLMAWPVRSLAGAARIGRVVVAGALLAWTLHP
jgi:hypothetical protein